MRAIKQPGEKLTFVYDFSADLGAGVLLAGNPIGGTPTSVPRGTGANLTVSGGAIVGTTDVRVTWDGGVDGESYHTTVRMADAAGNIHERDGEIFVIEEGFVLPTGIASRYLTADEYVDRFGYAETVRLTDEDKSDVVDKRKLEAAIKDATEIADGYIGTRYSTPLLDVPRVIKTIVAALAREQLHKSRPTQEVKDRADLARQQLRDIAAGKMTLPVDQGQAEPVVGGNRTAVTSNDYSSTFRDAVSDYSINPGAPLANWRR